MKKTILAVILLVGCSAVFGGQVGLPVERVAFPVVQGNHLVCIWDLANEAWLREFEDYDFSGSYEFQLPSWSKWYWIGLWDQANRQYVFGKWIGYFPSE